MNASHPVNRPHSVDGDTAIFLYRIYLLLFEASDIPARVKQRTFETAADSQNSWRVVSISEAAFQHIKDTGSGKGLQRGHILSRSKRSEHMFGRKEPMGREELLAYFFEHDTVALVTKKENSKDETTEWSRLHKVPSDLFTSGSFSINIRKRKELEWVLKHAIVAGAA